ncbi:MAG: peptidoglycan DD-metalloendopeptidase family protein [Bacteroidota bacterium]
MAEPVCHEWVNDDIHVRKYDFSLTTDTFAIVFGEEFGNYCHPRKDKVSSGFGTRRWRFHYGVDIGLDTGDPVYCAFDGVVRISTYSKTYGNVVVVRHANGLETLYAHLSKRSVDIDSTLLSGDVIGLGGNTGRSYGSHLHFETRFFDEAIDPRDIIDFENYDLLNDSLELTACHFHYRDYIKELNKIQYHIVKKGNTLSHIAKWYGTSVSQICRLNGISKSKVLQIGERIRVR